jgi:arabinose-5-phosphate isomerase
MTDHLASNFIESAKRTLQVEADSISALEQRIDQIFASACQTLLDCRGRIVVTGIGKSGHIANKIAATLASTGAPAFFMHAAEASHGDLGMLTADDVVIAISGSGQTQEVLSLIPLIKRMQTPLLSMTGNPDSELAKAADIHLDVSVEREACPHNLAPTSSTTAALAMGDALAVALLEARNFSAEDFAFSHPGGSLGKRLLLLVGDVMQAQFPRVSADTKLVDALLEITSKGLGMTTIMQDQRLLGIFTDGDLRRTLDEQIDIHNTPIDKVMTKSAKSIHVNTLAAQALNTMEEHNISSLVVVNDNDEVCGVVHLHALIKAGIA